MNGPSKVAGPPSATIKRASAEVINSKSGGLTNKLKSVHKNPAMPLKIPATMKAIYL